MRLPKETVLRIVGGLHAELDRVYGERLKKVRLYGSYARGDAGEYSDIDVAVILSGTVNRWEERERVGDIATEISLRENCLICLFFMSEAEEADAPYPIHRSIAREGVAV